MSVLTSPPAPRDAATPAPRPRGLLTGGRIGVCLWIAAMLVLPLVLRSELWLGIGILTLIVGVGALGMQVITGLAGQISLGHAFFMGIGAYSSAWLGADKGLPWWLWLPAAGLVAAAAGALVAPVAVRIRGLYLAVATLALVFIGLYAWETWTSLSGGVNGRPAAPVLFGDQDLSLGIMAGDQVVLDSFQAWWYFALAILLAVMLLTHNLKHSRLGRAFMAVRDKDVAAAVVGVPVTQTKTIAFVISSFFAGVSGALLVSYMGYFTPSQWHLMLSVDFIAMIVIGGMGTVSGALLGALFVRAMPEVVNHTSGFLPFVRKGTSTDGGITGPLLSGFLYGLVIVLILLFEPNGIRALVLRVWRRLRETLGRSRERRKTS
ncbi:branched-chain amino acid ABC transporter permease [Actinomadura sp. 6K520]|uniref:branched-chain amino acid ABC transporter permease n=1 Tax=Actinomadura sp. 6K520 TaxID=2530364 RepID=UPI001053DB92|nr:branched-chain amino acid ABC transporter permease [Actinomadura sp. 6K520]TDE22916.1 branched-chain amino acid ABC transporter permease [Actinomadura sp. 6K520]